MILLNEDSIFGKPSSPGLFVTVTLKHTDNRVWRNLLVPSDAHLGWFHAVLQIAMGWTNSHLHQFTFKDKTFSDPRFELYNPLTIDERKCSLDKLLTNSKDPLHYQYDFADSWEHAILLTKTGTTHYPMAATCLEGGGACPPEDCGGIPGYLSLLKGTQETQQQDSQGILRRAWLPLRPGRFQFRARQHGPARAPVANGLRIGSKKNHPQPDEAEELKPSCSQLLQGRGSEVFAAGPV